MGEGTIAVTFSKGLTNLFNVQCTVDSSGKIEADTWCQSDALSKNSDGYFVGMTLRVQYSGAGVSTAPALYWFVVGTP